MTATAKTRRPLPEVGDTPADRARRHAEKHRPLIDALYTLFHDGWVAPEHTEAAVERMKAGESLADIFAPYLRSPEHKTRLWFIRNDLRDLDDGGVANVLTAVHGKRPDSVRIEELEKERAAGRRLGSILHEALEAAHR